jgi:hypothetical protein
LSDGFSAGIAARVKRGGRFEKHDSNFVVSDGEPINFFHDGKMKRKTQA